jgi:hypothetical protein
LRTVGKDRALFVQECLPAVLDVWGLGNRGMFRSIRDLILRPGYSYFSTIWRLVAAFIPFVILCLLLAFAAVVIIAFSID